MNTMNGYLVAGAAVAFVVGLVHSVLGEMLILCDRFLCNSLALHDLRQTAFVVFLVIAALVIDFEEPVKQHHLPRRAQAYLPVG